MRCPFCGNDDTQVKGLAGPRGMLEHQDVVHRAVGIDEQVQVAAG